MKRIFAFLIFLLTLQNAYSGDRTDSEIHEIAYRQLYGGNNRRAGSEAKLKELLKNDLYTIIGTDQAFVIVSKKDYFTPVLAVSHTPYQASNMPDGFNWWLKEITESIKSGKRMTAVATVAVDNFITTEWGQNDPYNGLCPKIGTSRPPTGCVATALAQVMNYYQYPDQGTGSGSYTVDGKTKIVDIKKEYRWDRMLNHYDAKSAVLNKVAVQYLMADAGASVNMEYNSDGSAAALYYATYALSDNFRYDSLTLNYMERILYSDEEWMNHIYNEIEKRRPILYGAHDEKTGGHAFIFSGVDNEGKVYVNWGWEGVADGFYDIADLTPVNNNIEMGYHYTSNQQMVTGMRTTPSESLPIEDFMSHWISSERYLLKTLDKNKVELIIKNLYNYHFLSFSGIIELYFENVSGGKDDSLIFYESKDGEAIWPEYGFASEEGYIKEEIDITDLQEGNYKVYFRTKDIREIKPRLLRTPEGPFTIDLSKSADGTIKTSSDNEPDPTSIKVLDIEREHATSPQYFDLQGRKVDASARGLLIRKQGSEVKKVMVK